jgi:hypothetical protein
MASKQHFKWHFGSRFSHVEAPLKRRHADCPLWALASTSLHAVLHVYNQMYYPFSLYHNICLKQLAVLLEQLNWSELISNTKRPAKTYLPLPFFFGAPFLFFPAAVVLSLARSTSRALAFADLVTARFPVAIKDAGGDFVLAIVFAL